jgi:hypothetical protein
MVTINEGVWDGPANRVVSTGTVKTQDESSLGHYNKMKQN